MMSAVTRHCFARRSPFITRTTRLRLLHTTPLRLNSAFQEKYASKLEKKAEEKGLSVERLKEIAKEEKEKERKARLSQPLPRPQAPSHAGAAGDAATPYTPDKSTTERKDASPVKPLSSFLNLPLIMSKPHTKEQIAALWMAYHTRTNGYVCATIDADTYKQMIQVAGKYPAFLLPLPRPLPEGEAKEEQAAAVPHEFFFMEWALHGVPQNPTSDIFTKAEPTKHNLQTSTILFTPLQEYKLRQSFATPYLVLTNYTDLVDSHGVVLLRGEITPSTSGVAGKFMLSQTDAQVLSMGLQKFYLWDGEKDGAGRDLLKTFHEKPEEFKWEKLIEHAQIA